MTAGGTGGLGLEGDLGRERGGGEEQGTGEERARTGTGQSRWPGRVARNIARPSPGRKARARSDRRADRGGILPAGGPPGEEDIDLHVPFRQQRQSLLEVAGGVEVGGEGIGHRASGVELEKPHP